MNYRLVTATEASTVAKPRVSLSELEHLLGVDRATLRSLGGNWRDEYRPFEQEKPLKPFQREIKKAQIREIDNPSKELKRVQTKILKRLLHPVLLPYFLFGAVKKRSTNDHTREHLGSKCVVKMDVKSYYPNVTSHHVYKVWNQVLGFSPSIAGLLTQLTTYEWHLPQGAPTSPALANIFLSSIYGPVLASCGELNVKPTAWIDDLIFSGENARTVMNLVRQTLGDNGFKMSAKKRIILSGRDVKVITGVRLGAGRIRAPKEKVADLRAAIHKLELSLIEPTGRGRYIESLRGRLGHIENICSQDAVPLQRKLERALKILKKAPVLS
jgi:RNA-directed DNA polymerase